MTIPRSKDLLFVESSPYDYDLQLECSVSAYWMGNYEKCRQISDQLLLKTNLPLHVRHLVETNLSFCNKKLIEQVVNDDDVVIANDQVFKG